MDRSCIRRSSCRRPHRRPGSRRVNRYRPRTLARERAKAKPISARRMVHPEEESREHRGRVRAVTDLKSRIKSDWQAAREKRFVVRNALVDQRTMFRRNVAFALAPRLESGGLETASYQCGAQTPSLARGRPASQHARRERTPRRPHRRAGAPRVVQEALGVDHRRRRADAVGDGVVQRATAAAGRCPRPSRRARLEVRREHLARVADQEHVRQSREPAVPMSGSMWCVMCFWYQSGAPSGHGPASVAATLAPVGLAGGDHVVAAGMVGAGRGEVGA